MGLAGLGRFMRKFSRDVREVTQGFDRVIGPGPEPGVSAERTGRRAARTSPRRREREPLFRSRDMDLGFGQGKRGDDEEMRFF